MIRNFNDWEVSEYEVLLHLLSDLQVTSDRDKLRKDGSSLLNLSMII